MVKVPPFAVPQLGSCASAGRAWRLWAARHSQEEAGPLSALPLPRLLEPAASKAANSTALDHPIGSSNPKGIGIYGRLYDPPYTPNYNPNPITVQARLQKAKKSGKPFWARP